MAPLTKKTANQTSLFNLRGRYLDTAPEDLESDQVGVEINAENRTLRNVFKGIHLEKSSIECPGKVVLPLPCSLQALQPRSISSMMFLFFLKYFK